MKESSDPRPELETHTILAAKRKSFCEFGRAVSYLNIKSECPSMLSKLSPAIFDFSVSPPKRR